MTTLSDSLKELASPNAYPTPRISEDDFVKFLLPLIVNVNGVKNLDMSVWLDMAGNAHRPIDVYTPDGAVIFTVPPLLARVPTELPTKERTGVDISAILHHYGEKRLVEHPAAADAWFMGAIAGAIINVEEQQLIEYLKNWVIIYRRYNLPTTRLFGDNVDMEAMEKTETNKGKPDVAENALSGEFDDL